MTKLQKRIYILIMRCLILLLFHSFHNPQKEPVSESSMLRKDLTDTIVKLEESLQ